MTLPRPPGAWRLPFLLAAALIAGGLGDPLVETIADSGAVGAGYHDTNHLGVLPALLCGLVVAVEFVLLRAWALLRRDAHDGRGWLNGFAGRFHVRPPLHDVPYVFALQLVVVFAIETLEQIVSRGPLELGLSWLGGPVAFSLGVHALIALTVTLVLAALARALAAALASIVRLAFGWIALVRARPAVPPRYDRRGEAAFVRRRLLHRRRIGARAPPHLLAFA
ncbi:MAG TPA: hypothetical protein VHT05_12610 [Candidatus Elarobacter sp.]|jgi:hypothetical protein|nr:hypothetical protein [Candidatus Elarobacter sp.]